MIFYSVLLGFLFCNFTNAVRVCSGIPFKPRWAHSKWNSMSGAVLIYDKLEHFLGSAILTFGLYYLSTLLYLHDMGAWQAAVSAVIFGFSWEIKDSFFPWEKFGAWGGDGFDWKDLAADIAGAVLVIGGISWIG